MCPSILLFSLWRQHPHSNYHPFSFAHFLSCTFITFAPFHFSHFSLSCCAHENLFRKWTNSRRKFPYWQIKYAHHLNWVHYQQSNNIDNHTNCDSNRMNRESLNWIITHFMVLHSVENCLSLSSTLMAFINK